MPRARPSDTMQGASSEEKARRNNALLSSRARSCRRSLMNRSTWPLCSWQAWKIIARNPCHNLSFAIREAQGGGEWGTTLLHSSEPSQLPLRSTIRARIRGSPPTCTHIHPYAGLHMLVGGHWRTALSTPFQMAQYNLTVLQGDIYKYIFTFSHMPVLSWLHKDRTIILITDTGSFHTVIRMVWVRNCSRFPFCLVFNLSFHGFFIFSPFSTFHLIWENMKQWQENHRKITNEKWGSEEAHRKTVVQHPNTRKTSAWNTHSPLHLETDSVVWRLP